MSHTQHTGHGQCCCCARATAAQAEEPEPFRFTDIPPGQWIVGSLMILAIVIGIAVRMS
ncbi:hypothetical protein AB0A05_07495 [Streptomyces sp. NPDC046374]|uniref:hypothetical protein n=1 Tax=Streptomyces sp. NPDC046374 TaxID=3154917 RepID=UPI0033D06409